MIRPWSRPVATVLALLVSTSGHALPMGAHLAATLEEHGGNGFDLDFYISPTEHLTLGAGAGHATSSDASGSLAGTVLNVGLALDQDRFGVSLDYDHFGDSSNYQVGTLGARAWFEAGDLRFALLARKRDMAVTLRLDLPRQTLSREIEFGAFGVGGQVSYLHGRFSAYGMALAYEYDDDFERFLQIDDGPRTERRPRLEALLNSFVLQTQGAIDRQAAAGCEFSMGRHALAFDVSSLHDAVLDADSTSFGITWRYAKSSRMDWGVTAGIIDGDVSDDVGFLGVMLGINN